MFFLINEYIHTKTIKIIRLKNFKKYVKIIRISFLYYFCNKRNANKNILIFLGIIYLILVCRDRYLKI